MSPIPLGFWATAGAGGAAAGAYELISSTILSSGQSTISLTSISQTYKHLQLRVVAQGNPGQDFDILKAKFNGSTGNDYSWHIMRADGTSVISTGAATQSEARLGYYAGNSTTNNFGTLVVDFLDYSSTTKNKTVRSLSGTRGGSVPYLELTSTAYLSTNAISSISLFSGYASQFQAGSRFSLYGIKG